MQAKKRYILVFVSCAFLAYCYFGGYRLKRTSKQTASSSRSSISVPENLPSYLLESEYNAINDKIDDGEGSDSVSDDDDLNAVAHLVTAGSSDKFPPPLLNSNSHLSPAVHHSNRDDSRIPVPVVELPVAAPLNQVNGDQKQRQRSCRMETCFDYSKCSDANKQFLVYVYAPETTNPLGNTPPISLNYQKILSAITESRYYTPDPDKACLFVLGIDTLDRDSLSEDYVRNVPSRLQRLPYWNNGRNHVIFNLYSGTWPDYAENSLGFDTGEAILAKASMSVRQIRPAFDISIPLFHKQHPLRAGNTGFVTSNNFPTNKKYLLAFKGKR